MKLQRVVQFLDSDTASRCRRLALRLGLPALLLGSLLATLHGISARAERQAVDLSIRNLRTSLQLAMASALMQQRGQEIAAWVGSNPVLKLATPPPGYQGHCPDSGLLGSGDWCFAPASGELRYRPKVARLTNDCQRLTWRIVPADTGPSNDGMRVLQLQPLGDCAWRTSN